jgi:hypothetical protein
MTAEVECKALVGVRVVKVNGIYSPRLFLLDSANRMDDLEIYLLDRELHECFQAVSLGEQGKVPQDYVRNRILLLNHLAARLGYKLQPVSHALHTEYDGEDIDYYDSPIAQACGRFEYHSWAEKEGLALPNLSNTPDDVRAEIEAGNGLFVPSG